MNKNSQTINKKLYRFVKALARIVVVVIKKVVNKYDSLVIS